MSSQKPNPAYVMSFLSRCTKTVQMSFLSPFRDSTLPNTCPTLSVLHVPFFSCCFSNNLYASPFTDSYWNSNMNLFPYFCDEEGLFQSEENSWSYSMCLKQFSKKILKSNFSPFLLEELIVLHLHAQHFVSIRLVSKILCITHQMPKKHYAKSYCSFLFILLSREKGTTNFFRCYRKTNCLEKFLCKTIWGNSWNKPI